MSKSSLSTPDRSRHWSAIVYPESAPENWVDLLSDLHVSWACSPLHDLDVDPSGELKKPHWHLAFTFDGLKSFSQVKQITDLLNAPIPQTCHSLKGLVRYFCHLDNPDKHQYSMSDVQVFGGFDLSAVLAPTASERYALLDEIVDFIISEGIVELADLMDYARRNRREDWFPLLCDSTFMVTYLIRSNRHKLRFHSDDE